MCMKERRQRRGSSPILIQLFHHYDPLLQYLPTCLLHTFDTLRRVLTRTKAADMKSLGGEVSVFLEPLELPYYSSVFKTYNTPSWDQALDNGPFTKDQSQDI